MAYTIVIGGDFESPLASVAGWSDWKEWAFDLPEDFDELHHLAAHGWCQELPTFRDQLGRAIDEHEPSADVLHTSREMIVSLTEAPEDAESMFVSDGTESDPTTDAAVEAAMESVDTEQEAAALLREAYP